MKTGIHIHQLKVTGLFIFIIFFSIAMISCNSQKKAENKSQAVSTISDDNKSSKEASATSDGNKKSNEASANQEQDKDKYQEHIVQPGESLSVIAKKYGVDIDAIVKLNNIKDVNLIIAGETLLIPKPENGEKK
jgi:LysM repeat protein